MNCMLFVSVLKRRVSFSPRRSPDAGWGRFSVDPGGATTSRSGGRGFVTDGDIIRTTIQREFTEDDIQDMATAEGRVEIISARDRYAYNCSG